MHKIVLLQEWYKKMLDKGIIERIVLDYKDIYKQVSVNSQSSQLQIKFKKNYHKFIALHSVRVI